MCFVHVICFYIYFIKILYLHVCYFYFVVKTFYHFPFFDYVSIVVSFSQIVKNGIQESLIISKAPVLAKMHLKGRQKLQTTSTAGLVLAIIYFTTAFHFVYSYLQASFLKFVVLEAIIYLLFSASRQHFLLTTKKSGFSNQVYLLLVAIIVEIVINISITL